jgi:hypothetical protein
MDRNLAACVAWNEAAVAMMSESGEPDAGTRFM